MSANLFTRRSVHLRIIQPPLTTTAHKSEASPIIGDKSITTETVADADSAIVEEPTFIHHAETTNIQLFFDLFFVANLSSFNEVHDINSSTSLSSYIGFFCILWFTWCQITLYDVRFITDSLVERLAHACHFGVMVGLAVVGPSYRHLHDLPWDMFRKLSIVLIVSRVVLLCQYGTVLYFSWKYKEARRPLIFTMLALAVAVITYAGLIIPFFLQTNFNAYIAWFVVFVFEVVCSISIAAHWKLLRFGSTHLIERMTCLSLIFLGEGVIGVCKAIIKIEELDYGFSSSAIGTLICTVLIIYLVYNLYFDNVPQHHFGSIRQQIWAFLHFPFHLTLVLLTQGASQFVGWRHIVEFLETSSFANLNQILRGNYNTTFVFTTLNQTVYDTLINGPFSETVTYETVVQVLKSLDVIRNANTTGEDPTQEIQSVEIVVLRTIFDGYGFEPFETTHLDAQSPSVVIREYLNVFEFLFGYFFICAGLTLIGIGILTWLSLPKGRKGVDRAWRWTGIGAHFVWGLALTMLSLMVLSDAALNLGVTPWTNTIVTFVFLAVFITDQIAKRHIWAIENE